MMSGARQLEEIVSVEADSSEGVSDDTELGRRVQGRG